ncbi:MAG: Spy/CpxP family protein refolding chaperone [Hyphomicrobium sp.]|uniref:Spy/CpxP family protein refolding chaperone n=1 Tax=Hyphomicrobium sp. TaxID=82 RepID=UPI003569DDA7
MNMHKRVFIGLFAAMAVTASVASAQSPGNQGQGSGMMGNGGWGQGMMGNGYGMMGQGMMGNGRMGPGMMGYGGMGSGMMGPGMMMGSGPMLQGQLTYLKAELGITDAQKAVWDGYVDALQQRSTAMQGMHATMMQTWQSGSAIDRMNAHLEAMQGMLDSMKSIKPATEALYKALSDDQKKKADYLLGNGCCMM